MTAPECPEPWRELERLGIMPDCIMDLPKRPTKADYMSAEQIDKADGTKDVPTVEILSGPDAARKIKEVASEGTE